MSLQSATSVVFFSQKCQELWNSWRGGMSVAQRTTNRENKVRSAVNAITGFMAPLNIQFKDLGGDCGSFSWGSWRLKIDNTYTKKDNITYRDFIELCCTAFHETRHAEQFYRIAQGLALGKLSFPDKSKAEIIQDSQAIGGGGGVRAKIAAFEGRAMQSSPSTRRQMIARWLNIPVNVAGVAETAKLGFDGFINLPKPSWFKRQTALLEVEEWMRSTYKRTLGGMNEWAQSDHGPYKIYRDLPEEHDAHEIEKLIKNRVKQLIGHNYPLNKNQPRSNTGLFGN